MTDEELKYYEVKHGQEIASFRDALIERDKRIAELEAINDEAKK